MGGNFEDETETEVCASIWTLESEVSSLIFNTPLLTYHLTIDARKL